MPFPVGYEKDFGEYLDDREEALERLPNLLDSDWTIVDSSSSTSSTPSTLGSPASAIRSRSRSISSNGSIPSTSSPSTGNTSNIKILSSSLSYVTFNLLPTSSIFVAWKLNLLVPTSEVSTLIPLLSLLEVQLGRRIILNFSNKKSGTREEAARLFPLVLPKDSTSMLKESDIKRIDLGMNSGVTKIELGGWLEVEKDLVEGSQSCNSSAKTYLTASLKEPGLKLNAGDGVILAIEVELFKSMEQQISLTTSMSTSSSNSRISRTPSSSNSSGSKNSKSLFSKSSSPSSSTSSGSLNPFSRRLNSSSTFNSAYPISSPSGTSSSKRNSSNFSDTATYNSRFSMSSDGAETIRSVGKHSFF